MPVLVKFSRNEFPAIDPCFITAERALELEWMLNKFYIDDVRNGVVDRIQNQGRSYIDHLASLMVDAYGVDSQYDMSDYFYGLTVEYLERLADKLTGMPINLMSVLPKTMCDNHSFIIW